MKETAYDEDRLDRYLWGMARRPAGQGISRRTLLGLTAAGVGGMALGLGGTARAAVATCVDGGVIKPTPDNLFILQGTNREMRWEAMRQRGVATGRDLFFVRNHSCTPTIDKETWHLTVEGTGVSQPLSLSYDDLTAMESVTVTRRIECAGNGRSFFTSQQGTPAPGTQWGLGAVGVASWTGVPLWRVLQRAGVTSDAVDVMPEGLDDEVPDQGRVRRPMPIDKALRSDTLLVYAMDGKTLPPDHGFPVRVLVPGWVGVANIKWLGKITVSKEPLFSTWNTTSYRLLGAAYPDAPILTTVDVKSAFELPTPATLAATPQILLGRSWSGENTIDAVDVSVDNGITWASATFISCNEPGSWVRWRFPWSPTPGQYNLMARARDSLGQTQPLTVPFNDLGYSFWAVVKHPVTVQ
jgi:sulfane dehydrogenase subunit SoxC